MRPRLLSKNGGTRAWVSRSAKTLELPAPRCPRGCRPSQRTPHQGTVTHAVGSLHAGYPAWETERDKLSAIQVSVCLQQRFAGPRSNYKTPSGHADRQASRCTNLCRRNGSEAVDFFARLAHHI